MPISQGGRAASAAADGSFVMQSVPPGRYRVQPSIIGGAAAGFSGWRLHSVMSGDRDVADLPFDLASGADLSGLVVTFTNKRTEVTGSVRDSRGEPVNEYVAVVFTEDRQQWTPQSRAIAAARSDREGGFTIAGLPAGRYLAAVVDTLEPTAEHDPELLDRLSSTAVPLTLQEGERKTLALRAAR